MAKYIFTERNGIYIVDLQKTANQIEDAYKAIRDIVADGGKVLFVGTKNKHKTLSKLKQRDLVNTMYLTDG